ncbi:MAG: ParA family protein [Planctomycetota bacterium]
MLITFASEKGGVGKTTTAVHAAAYLADLGHDVAFFAGDGRRSTIEWLEAARPDIPHLATTDLDYATEVVDKMNEAGITMVADAPPGLGPIPLLLLSRSARVIVPTAPGLLDLAETHRTFAAFCKALGPDQQHRAGDFIAFVNRFEKGNRNHEETAGVLAHWGVRTAKTHVCYRRPVNNAPMLRATVFDATDRFGKEAAAELRELFTETFPKELTRPVTHETTDDHDQQQKQAA